MNASNNEDSRPLLSVRRRAIFERASAKYRALGTPIDADPSFVGLIEEWIEGRMEMTEVAQRASVRPEKHEPSTDGSKSETESIERQLSHNQLLSELDRLIGLHDR